MGYNVTTCPYRSFGQEHATHPDAPDIKVTGQVIPNMKEILKLVEDSHYKTCPDVPIVGWDVVLSTNENVPICLLEVNLSCNFFRGSFDQQAYFDFIDESFAKIQALRLTADAEKKQFRVKI